MSGTHSVPSSILRAGNSTLYYYRAPNLLPSIGDILNDHNVNESVMHPIARAACVICFLYLCRIAEVLSLCASDVIAPDRCLCRGSKRGHSYIVYLPDLSSQLKKEGLVGSSTLLFPISYSQCYRSLVRAGVRYCRSGFSNSSRSHIARYSVRHLAGQGVPPETLTDLLHHKSKKSILYYLNERKLTYGKNS